MQLLYLPSPSLSEWRKHCVARRPSVTLCVFVRRIILAGEGNVLCPVVSFSSHWCNSEVKLVNRIIVNRYKITRLHHLQGVSKSTKFVIAFNLDICQQIFIVVARRRLNMLNQPNTVCVTALPCKSWSQFQLCSRLYWYTADVKHDNFIAHLCNKWNNTRSQLQQMFEMSSYWMATGPDQIILISCESLLPSCMHNELWLVVIID